MRKSKVSVFRDPLHGTALRKLAELLSRGPELVVPDWAVVTLFLFTWKSDFEGRRGIARKSSAYSRLNPQLLEDIIADYLSGNESNTSVHSLLETQKLKDVSEKAHLALKWWAAGEIELDLVPYVPTAAEVLGHMIEGRRFVSLVFDGEHLDQEVGDKSNCFDMVIHDLEHAFHFFRDRESHLQQRGFFAALQSFGEDKWVENLKSHPHLFERWEYLISDMNTHPQHAVLFLRALIYDAAAIDGEGRFAAGTESEASLVWQRFAALLANCQIMR